MHGGVYSPLRMRTLFAAVTTATLAAGTSAAQTPARPAFEVSSINPAASVTLAGIASGTARVGMTVNDARVDLAYLTLSDLLPLAYRVKPHQIASLVRSSGAAQALGLPPNLAALGGAAGAASEPAGNSVFQAVQKLGLRLDPERAPIDVIVVDKLEKTPTAN